MPLRVRVRYPPGMLEEASRVASALSVNGVKLELVEDEGVDGIVIEGPSFATKELDEALRVLDSGSTGRQRRHRSGGGQEDQTVPEWRWDW